MLKLYEIPHFLMLIASFKYILADSQAYIFNDKNICGKGRKTTVGRNHKIVNGIPVRLGDYPWQVCIECVFKQNNKKRAVAHKIYWIEMKIMRKYLPVSLPKLIKFSYIVCMHVHLLAMYTCKNFELLRSLTKNKAFIQKACITMFSIIR